MKFNTLRDSYDKIAEWWTQAQSGNPEYGMNFIRRAMSHAIEGGTALDIGCGGTGRVIGECINRGFEVIGIDVSLEMINLAKDKYPHAGLINIDFMNWETNRKFDLIIAWDSIFHAPRIHQISITRKMCSLLNNQGILIFTAGGVEGERSGIMHGVKFYYGSLDYKNYINIVEEMKCKTILMERDQFPMDHMVLICQKQ